MKNSYKRFCFLIASAEFREEDLLDIATAIKESSPSEFANEILSARRNILSYSKSSNADLIPKDRKKSDPVETLEEKVSQLLVINAGLSKGVAAEELLNVIKTKYPELFLPNIGKMGFGQWIKRISKHLPPSEILFFANTIRNQHVHDKNIDWRLK